jgi:hypothetical protein
VFSRRRFLFTLFPFSARVRYGSVGDGLLEGGPSPASPGNRVGVCPIPPANRLANRRTESPVPLECEDEDISFPWCTIPPSLGTKWQVRWVGKSWAGQGLIHNLCRCVLIRPPVNTIAVNHRVIVRILFAEPNSFPTRTLRLLVDARQAPTP